MRTRTRICLSCVPLLAYLLTSCADSGGPALVPCSDSLAVSVGPGVEPLFTWSPNCRAEYITVVDSLPSGGELARWAIRARTTGQGSPSPVRYAHAPANMNVEFQPVALVVGHQYLVRVYPDSGGALGQALFTP
jgi:hypothetical protein